MSWAGALQRTGPMIRAGVLLFVLSLFAAACGRASSPPASAATLAAHPLTTPTASHRRLPSSSPFPLVLTDSNGDQVAIDRPPKRIVAIDTAAVEILFAMGEGDRVVGTHIYFSMPGSKNIERVGDAFTLNFEKIAALLPDLVYIFYARPLHELKKLGVPALYLKFPVTFEEVADRMRLWGKLVDRPGAGEKLARRFELELVAVKRKVAVVKEGPRVFHYEGSGLWTSGSGTLIQEVYSLLNARNIFADLWGFQQVSPEAIVARDPQVVISVRADGPAAIKSDPAFQAISAVKTGKLFVVDGALLSVAGPRLVQGIEQVAKLLYPDLFP